MTTLAQRLGLSFGDPGVERAYQTDVAQAGRTTYRVLTLLVLALVVSSSFTDERLVTSLENVAVMQRIRLSLPIPASLAAVALGFAPAHVFRRVRVPALIAWVAALQWANLLAAALVPDPELLDARMGLLTAATTTLAACTMLGLGVLAAVVATLPANAALIAIASVRWPELAQSASMSLTACTVLGLYATHQLDVRQRRTFALTRSLEHERARSEALLQNILPEPIGERLKAGQRPIADKFAEATILFADIVGFTTRSQHVSPEALVTELDQIFSDLDALADELELEKIKTIGDAYMVVGGIPVPSEDHTARVARMALAMRRVARARGIEMRIGIHVGPVVAGVIGTRKLAYDLWGDAVNTASRMESHGVPGAIQVTEEVYERLRHAYAFEPRGVIAVKGKGDMPTFLLEGPLSER